MFHYPYPTLAVCPTTMTALMESSLNTVDNLIPQVKGSVEYSLTKDEDDLAKSLDGTLSMDTDERRDGKTRGETVRVARGLVLVVAQQLP